MRACQEVRESVPLRHVIAMTLKAGNYLNKGTSRGNAEGFFVDALLKLIDTRDKHNKVRWCHAVLRMFSDCFVYECDSVLYYSFRFFGLWFFD